MQPTSRTESNLPRTLWYLDANQNRVDLPQKTLADLTQPLLILGEAGMGKSSLLTWLADTYGYARCTASQLINRSDPRSLLGNARALVIDGLDEVSAVRDGDAVSRVLQRLGELNYPRFVLACRSADWRSATGVQAISEQYPQAPLQLHLTPFTDAQALVYLEQRLDAPQARTVIEHFNTLGLEGLLGNPQTLDMIIPAIKGNKLPQTRSELFDLATQQLALEHNERKTGDQLPLETTLDTAGAAFSALLLSGNEAITRRPHLYAQEGELPLAEISSLDGGQHLSSLLSSRLFRATGPERFSYWHRRIGEYLGARWLARQADTPRKRRRLLALFHNHGLVPANLRGLHAWLAQAPELAPTVISADPMGVVEYGDPAVLTPTQAKTLLHALQQLASDNPRFRDWRNYGACGLDQPALLPELRQVITSKDQSFDLRLLILQSIQKIDIIRTLQPELLALVQDQEDIYLLRYSAAEMLTRYLPAPDWPAVVHTLKRQGDENSVRLALEVSHLLGYALLDDSQISSLVLIHTNQDERLIGRFAELEKDFPTDRIHNFLEHLTQAIKAAEHLSGYHGKNELINLVYHLIGRYLQTTTVEAKVLWRWLQPSANFDGYPKESRQQLHHHLQATPKLRQAVQHLVLLGQNDGKNIWQRRLELNERSSGFICSEEDIISLLASLNPQNQGDKRWRDLIQLVGHDHEQGVLVRAAARPFAAHSLDELQWLDDLAKPYTPQWQLEQNERHRAREDARIKRHTDHREHYSSLITQMRLGESETIVDPAQAYLKLYSDVGNDLLAHQRIAQWLGTELADAAHAGFETFLKQEPPHLSATQIAKSHAEKMFYPNAYIIIAALAERLRKQIGFSDLSDERLMAGLFALYANPVSQHAGIDELESQLQSELQARNCWGEVARQFIEPMLQAGREPVDNLHTLMRDSTHTALAIELALDWLQRFPELPMQVEAVLVDRLLRSERHTELLSISQSRRANTTDTERQSCWDAVGLIVDFERTSSRLAAAAIEPTLLWHIRDRTQDQQHSYGLSTISWCPAQLEWVITTFRSPWPFSTHPDRPSGGALNTWDASEYLGTLIRRLGNDTSPEAGATLKRLREAAPDGYTSLVRTVSAEQRRMQVEATYTPPTLDAIVAITNDQPPASIHDLQSWMLEEIADTQKKIRSDDAESWRGFYEKQRNLNEEACRDHLIGLLRQGTPGVTFEPETHVAGDKEVDITCSTGKHRLPIEIKGQWHNQLWQGADKQLDRLYTADWRASGYGIYLVLWFGKQARMTSPGRGIERPATPKQMHDMLLTRSQAARDGRIAIVVLDLTRP